MAAMSSLASLSWPPLPPLLLFASMDDEDFYLAIVDFGVASVLWMNGVGLQNWVDEGPICYESM